MHDGMDGWMDGWMRPSMDDFIVEQDKIRFSGHVTPRKTLPSWHENRL